MNVRRTLEQRISAALSDACGAETPAMVSPSARPQFGDYQANGVMAAAKSLKTNPRKLAEQVAAAADVSDMTEGLEVAGPGFINIRLRADFLAKQLAEAAGDDRLGAPLPAERRTVVIDYSSPNLAKEMHVGHLRSTIIGDSLARVLDFLGHKVIRQNHVGDWGTQFGMLLANMVRHERMATQELRAAGALAPGTGVTSSWLPNLEAHYQEAKRLFDTDESFASESRQYVVRLQAGDDELRSIWQRYVDISLAHCGTIYKRLGVKLTRDDVRGESFYNSRLPEVVAELGGKGLLAESQGAQCVFLDEFKGKDGKPLPMIVQKSDGAFLYSTSDLAAIRYRVGQLGAGRILYVTDSRQALHFNQLFAVARKAGFAPGGVSLEYVPFGTMQGPDGKPFKTREGGTVKLLDLLDEAEQRALAVVRAKNPDLPADEAGGIARVLGIGAVKYSDLSQNRVSDYAFSFDRMLSLDGNTAPYMQYAYARICSIFRKASGNEPGGVEVCLREPAERSLAVKLLQFPETVQSVGNECLPNLLCNYLYDLAVTFTGFYETCPVLKSDEPLRSSRLALCRSAARTIAKGLDLLGIKTVDQM